VTYVRACVRACVCVRAYVCVCACHQVFLGENHDMVLAPFNALCSDCLHWWPLLRIDRTKNRWCAHTHTHAHSVTIAPPL
jgi:hypothetical protein